jgi:hypothetical protein
MVRIKVRNEQKVYAPVVIALTAPSKVFDTSYAFPIECFIGKRSHQNSA